MVLVIVQVKTEEIIYTVGGMLVQTTSVIDKSSLNNMWSLNSNPFKSFSKECMTQLVLSFKVPFELKRGLAYFLKRVL